MPLVILMLAAVAFAFMPADYRGSNTWKTTECKGCCDANHRGFSHCGRCNRNGGRNITGHLHDCPKNSG